MKKNSHFTYFVFFVLSLFSTFLYAQSATILLADYNVTIDFKGKSKKSNFTCQLATDALATTSLYHFNQVEKVTTTMNDDGTMHGNINFSGGAMVVYHLDRQAQVLTTRDLILDKPYIITEDQPNFNWVIKEEYKKIGDLDVQLAMGSFRGRSYEAWFASSIPVDAGPWKFNGLPGLILEVADTEDIVKFQFKRLQRVASETLVWHKKPTGKNSLAFNEYFDLKREKTAAFLRQRFNRPGLSITSDIKFNELEIVK